MAVDDAPGPVGALEVDDVVADEVHGVGKATERVDEPCAQRFAPERVAPDLHIRHEQRRHRVHVARVDAQRVAHRELLDLGQRLESIETLLDGLRFPGSKS